MIRFYCPSGHQLNVEDQLAGQRVRCGECRKVAVVPEVSSAAGGGSRRTRPGSRKPRHSVRSWLRGPTSMPRDVYEPEAVHVRSTYGLAALLAVAVVFSLFPALWLGHASLDHAGLWERFTQGHAFHLGTAPGWARAAVLIGTVQLIYIAWMASAPDWSSVWVVMLVFAVTATAYAVATATALFTPIHYSLPLEMWQVRESAAKWCAAVLAVMSLCTYLCGRASTQWNRDYRQEMTRRRQRRSSRRAHRGKLVLP